MIPTTRAVIGRDLENIKARLGLTKADVVWLLGMTSTSWTRTTKSRADLPVEDPTLALLVRFLDEHPDAVALPKERDGEAMFSLLNEIQPTTQKSFAVLLGAEATAGYRWRRSEGVSATSERLMHYLRKLLSDIPARQVKARQATLDHWANIVAAEGASRGVPDVFASGYWAPRAPRVRRSPARPATQATGTPSKKRSARA